MIKDYLFCTHRVPPITCYCRKPNVGMSAYFIENYKLLPSECIMVGDTGTDKSFAIRSGFHDEFLPTQNKCIPCYEKRQEYYQTHRNQEIARAKRCLNKDRNHTNAVKRAGLRKNPVSYILWRIRAKCKKQNIPFDLTHEDIIVPAICPVLGIPLIIDDGNAKWSSPSVDRIIPSLGYVRGNIQIISHRANTIKNDASSAELEQVLKYVKRTEQYHGQRQVFCRPVRVPVHGRKRIL